MFATNTAAIDVQAATFALTASIFHGETGGTFTPDGQVYQGTTGYVVSFGSDTCLEVPAIDIDHDAIHRFLARTWRTAAHTTDGELIVGWWLHKGRVYVDWGEVDQSLPRAITKAIRREQLAIYSLATGTEIETGK